MVSTYEGHGQGQTRFNDADALLAAHRGDPGDLGDRADLGTTLESGLFHWYVQVRYLV